MLEQKIKQEPSGVMARFQTPWSRGQQRAPSEHRGSDFTPNISLEFSSSPRRWTQQDLPRSPWAYILLIPRAPSQAKAVSYAHVGFLSQVQETYFFPIFFRMAAAKHQLLSESCFFFFFKVYQFLIFVLSRMSTRISFECKILFSPPTRKVMEIMGL